MGSAATAAVWSGQSGPWRSCSRSRPGRGSGVDRESKGDYDAETDGVVWWRRVGGGAAGGRGLGRPGAGREAGGRTVVGAAAGPALGRAGGEGAGLGEGAGSEVRPDAAG